MPENLVSFPAAPHVAPAVSHACAVFLQRWNGTDIQEGARLLTDLLPERVPGPLKLVILRALRQLDVPPFSSAEAFRDAVARFANHEPELQTLADVRRARRATRLTLDAIAKQASLPVYMLRQLEWGDFRQWHNADWSDRVTRAYARATRLDPDRIAAIVEEERLAQLQERAMTAAAGSAHSGSTGRFCPPEPGNQNPPSEPDVRTDRQHQEPVWARRRATRAAAAKRFGLAAAAVGMFVAGLGVGGAIIERHSARDGRPPVLQQADAAERAGHKATPALNRRTSATAGRADASITDESAAARSRPAPEERADHNASSETDAPPAVADPSLTSASVAGAPAFSPSFSNVGSAVFYHRDEGVGTALVKADRDETTGDLRVINIVEDNARNYHVRPSPDGSRIAFDSDRDGERGVYTANADGTDVRRVSGPGFAAVPSWSPDGSLLAFVRAEQDPRTWNLWLLDLKTNGMRRVTDYRYGQPWGASWFPDGRRVAYSHEDRLTVLDLPTGTKRIFKSPQKGQLVRTPAVSPDGRHIVFQVYRDGAWMLDLRDGSMERILADPTAEEFAWDSTGRRLAFHSRRSGSWSVWIMAGPSS